MKENKYIKNNNLIIICLITLFLLSLSSCKKNNEITLINEVKQYEVEMDEQVLIKTTEDLLVNAIAKAEQSIVGIVGKTKGIILNNTFFGSGVIIKRKSLSASSFDNLYRYYVITNKHVITNNKSVLNNLEIYVNGSYIKANFIYLDNQIDIALLSFDTSYNLSVASIGESNNLQKGRYAIAIGNPYDLEILYRSVTIGFVSHPNRQYSETTEDGRECINYYIQHDAAINGGNSGGGLFNLSGELIGINTWKITGGSDEAIENIGFAVPIHIAYNVVSSYTYK